MGGRGQTAEWALAVVLLVSLLAFAPGIVRGHLGIDDWSYVCGCPFVRDGLTTANVAAAFSDFGYCAIWMPLTFLSYMADITLFGGGWGVHHAVNVVLHGANAALAFLLLLMLAKRCRTPGLRPSASCVWACAFATLAWAVHPMRAEAVAFVASRKEELWTLFALSGLMAWLGFLEKGGAGRYLLTLALFALACLSKPTAMCFPLLAALLEAAVGSRGSWRRRAFRYLPMLAVSLFVGLVAVYSQSNPTGMERANVFNAPLDWRLLNAAVSLGLYLWHEVCPLNIHFDYRAVFGGWPVDGGLGLVVLGVALLAIVAVCGCRRCASARRMVMFAALWFLLGVLPTLGIFGYVNGDQACADRYAYLPSLAFSPLLVWAVVRIRRARVACALACALIAGEIALALPVIRSFHDDFSAYSRTLERDPDHWRALRIVGNEYCARRGRMDEGVRMLRKSLHARGSQLTADSLAYVLAIRGAPGDFSEVKRMGRPFLVNPQLDAHGMMLDALAIVCMREGDDKNAAILFRAALSVPRRNHSAGHSLLNLGLTLANQRRDREALAVLAKAEKDPIPEVRIRAQRASAMLRSGSDRPRFEWR